MTVAAASIQALTQSLDDGQQAELAETALRSLRAVELQVGRLGRLQGLSGGELQRRPTDLVALVRELITDLDTSLLHDHPTELDAPDELVVDVDPDQIRQVVYNLLSNAAKYSPQGRVVVVAIEEHADELRLEVRDLGDGVAPENADRIFGKYERVDEEIPGAGLGLYLARLVIEAHGGQLSLVPAEGEGAIFRVELPRADARLVDGGR